MRAVFLHCAVILQLVCCVPSGSPSDDLFASILHCRHGHFFFGQHIQDTGLEMEHLAEYGEWENNNVEFLLELINEGNLVLDVGAHVGEYTVPFAQKVGPTGRVIALETQRDDFQSLSTNLAINGLRHVFPQHMAVGDRNIADVLGSAQHEKDHHFYQQVPQYTLSTLLSIIHTGRNNPVSEEISCPSLIKIDVAGTELEVLQGGEEIIRACHPYLFLGNHDKELSAPLNDFLLELDYQAFWGVEYRFNKNNYFQSTKQLRSHGSLSINIFCIPATELLQNLEIIESLDALGFEAIIENHFLPHDYFDGSLKYTQNSNVRAPTSLTLVQQKHSRDMQQSFSEIYDHFLWGKEGEGSGPGSALEGTAGVRAALPGIVQAYNITSFLDAPCGAFHWMRVLLPEMKQVHSQLQYEGADIVPSVIDRNRRNYPDVSFFLHDIVHNDLPKSYDLIMTRDVFFHLHSKSIMCALAHFQASLSTYLLTNTDPNTDNTNTETWRPSNNATLDAGAYRQINLQRPPYNFPEPLTFVPEDTAGRGLGLWRLDSIPMFRCSS